MAAIYTDRRTMLAGGAALLAMPQRAIGADIPASILSRKLVDATGGAANWRAIGGLEIRARHYEVDIEEPYDNLILMDLAAPYIRVEGHSATMQRVRAVTGNKGWRVSEISPFGPLASEQVASDLAWWEAHVYRNIWRLARGDPELTPVDRDGGILEIRRPSGDVLMSYHLNLTGEPVSFTPFYATNPTLLGPLEDRAGGLRSPAWSSSADAGFRVDIVDWRGTPGRPPADYERP